MPNTLLSNHDQPLKRTGGAAAATVVAYAVAEATPSLAVALTAAAITSKAGTVLLDAATREPEVDGGKTDGEKKYAMPKTKARTEQTHSRRFTTMGGDTAGGAVVPAGVGVEEGRGTDEGEGEGDTVVAGVGANEEKTGKNDRKNEHAKTPHES